MYKDKNHIIVPLRTKFTNCRIYDLMPFKQCDKPQSPKIENLKRIVAFSLLLISMFILLKSSFWPLVHSEQNHILVNSTLDRTDLRLKSPSSLNPSNRHLEARHKKDVQIKWPFPKIIWAFKPFKDANENNLIYKLLLNSWYENSIHNSYKLILLDE